MLKVKKCGKTDYGFWAVGVLEYKGLIIKDLFSVNKALEEGKKYDVDTIHITRRPNGDLKIKLEII